MLFLLFVQQNFFYSVCWLAGVNYLTVHLTAMKNLVCNSEYR